jgi:hypothetical protein
MLMVGVVVVVVVVACVTASSNSAHDSKDDNHNFTIIIIRNELNLDRPLSAAFNSVFKSLPSRLRPSVL